MPRFKPGSACLFEKPFDIVDAASFVYMFEEIFEHQIYKFNADTDTPTIIDCGANVGLSILYFKRLFPESRIIAFEPDRIIFGVLENNVRRFNLSNVKLFNKAVWSSETLLKFVPDGADGGRVTHTESSQDYYEVPTVRLSKYLNAKIDFLKLDIEGAESEVLVECRNRLERVKNLFVEYHSFADQPQKIHTIIEVLAGAGFLLHFHTPVKSLQPFYFRETKNSMDMQVNIFAYR
jgi:FkbM family methyltransferase